MQPTILSTFDTMTQYLRGTRGWGLLRHCIVTPFKLLSRNSLVSATLSTAYIGNFTHGVWNDGGTITRTMFGLGKVIGDTSSIEIYKWNDVSESWDTLANASVSSGSLDYTKFFYFEGFLYGYRSNASIFKFGDVRDVGANAFTDGWYTGSWTHSTQPHAHTNSTAYFAMDSTVYALETGDTTMTGTALVLTFNDGYITSLSSRGNFLSIMYYHESADKTVEYLWDTNSTSYNDSVDWGSGKVVHHAEMSGGIILAVQDERIAQSGDTSDASIKLRRSSGGQIITEHEIRADSGSPVIGQIKKTFEDSLLFYISYTQNDDLNEGICSLSADGSMSIPFTNDFSDATTKTLGGFEIHGNQWFVSYPTAALGAYAAIVRTGSGTLYKSTAITRAIDNGDPLQTKKVQGVSVVFSPMTTSSLDYIKVYYKDEDQTSWTQIGEMLGSATNSGKTRLSIINENGGDTLRPYKTRQYKIDFVGVDFFGLRTARPKPINDEPYSI